MSLFERLNSSGQQNRQNPAQALQQIKSNPVNFLKQAGFSVPDGVNNPQQIINHLLQSGQVQQSRYAQVMQMISGKR